MLRRSALVAFTVVLVGVLVTLLGAATSEPVVARQGGVVGYSGNPTLGGTDCSQCHMDPQRSALASITVPQEPVAPGQTVQLVINVSGLDAVVGGLNLSVADGAGTLAPADTETREQFGEITHTGPKQMIDQATSFTVEWTAPTEAGSAWLYAAVVAGNGNGLNSGDTVGLASAEIVVEAAGVRGDSNCSGTVNIADALFIAQWLVQRRTDGGGCPLADSATQLNAAQGDFNENGTTDIADALFIAQCEVGIDNGFCLTDPPSAGN